MSDLLKRLASLSPADRARLALQLQDRAQAPAPQTRTANHAPQSFAQQRLWFLDQLEGPSSTYNIPAAFRLGGSLDVGALERSLDAFVQRHEVLRTTFGTYEGEPVQIVHPHTRLTLPVVDLSGPGKLSDLLAREAQRPFDLTQGPLFRFTLLRLGAADHVLMLLFHHIVADGWSIGVLGRELGELYRAFRAGAPAPLPNLPLQYADVALWQRERLRGRVLEADLDYWRRQLGGNLSLLQLPTDRPRRSTFAREGAAVRLDLPPGLLHDLRRVASEQRVTLFMLLLAAFQLLLHRYSGQEDILVGTPIANRTHREMEALFGFLANTLVLRTNLGGDPTFAEVLSRVREATLAAQEHQDVPFEKVVDALQVERSLDHSPLFQAMFSFQQVAGPALTLEGLTIEEIDVPTNSAKFDLNLGAIEGPTGLALRLDFSTALFDATTMERMLAHFHTLLEGVTASAETPVSALPLLSPAERQQSLYTWNETAVDFPQDRCVHELIATRAAEAPDAVAVRCGGEHLTYRALNERANQLAHRLRRAGIGPDRLVGLYLRRSIEMVVAVLGVLKAGGAYVPIDPAYPSERVAYMLADSGVEVLLTQTDLAAHAPTVIYLDHGWEALSQESPADPGQTANPTDLAYVIYTSGSTGRPKGAMIEHRGLLNYLQWAISYYGAGGAPVHSSLSFDLTVTSLYIPLLTGHTIDLIPAEPAVEGLSAVLTGPGPYGVVKLTPAHLKALSNLGVPAPGGFAAGTMVIGGEELHATDVGAWRRIAPGVRLINEYGPTETVVGCCVYEVTTTDPETGVLPIGRPIANTYLYILDARMEPTPIGVAGELYIGGVQVGRGYLGRPDLTQERFLPDPFRPGGRIYRTGDLARYRPDGTIEFLGRIDHQVKIRGYRIELGEIEAQLQAHSAVREAVVVARADGPGERQLVAYLVASAGVAVEDLRAHLGALLPDYMVPSAFVFLTALPLTTNGKVDRQALPAPERPASLAAFTAPRTPAELVLATIWAELLRVDRISVHDNFFALGGDSILSLQVVARANQAGLYLTPRLLFTHQTVATLATASGGAPAPAQAPQASGVAIPLSPNQQRFVAQQFPNEHLYGRPYLFEVAQPCHPGALAEALRALTDRHDALRLRFRRSPEGLEQVDAGPAATTPFARIDLSDCADPAAAIAAEAGRQLQQLDLTHGPLVRGAFFDLGPDQPGRLLLIAHTLVMDNVSWRIFLHDLETAYGQLTRGEPLAPPGSTASFATWSGSLAQLVRSGALDTEVAYWRQVANQPSPPVLTGRPGGRNIAKCQRSVTADLDEAETRILLQVLPGVLGAQVNDLLLTALGRAVGGGGLLVDLRSHGREDLVPGLETWHTIGLLSTVYPVWLAGGTLADPVAALRRVQQQLQAVPRGGVGYGLLRTFGPPDVAAQLTELPSAPISFNYLGQFDQRVSAEGPFKPARERLDSPANPLAPRQHLLDLVAAVVENRLRFFWTYSDELLDPALVTRLADAYGLALRGLINLGRS